jgi:hypothetical protein
MKTRFLLTAIAACIISPSYAANTDALANQYIQEIHVVNLLANNDLTDPGMTPTAILVDYYSSGSWPCWTNHLAYRDDITIHAGPTQGCKQKVNRVVITPMMTFDKLRTYVAPVHLEIDQTKYATQIIVLQDTPPSFDNNSGLVITSGTMRAQTQSQLKE